MQGRNLQLWQSTLQSPVTVDAKWQSLPGHRPHYCRYLSSRQQTNPLLPRGGTKSSTGATCTWTNSCSKGPGSRRAGSGLLGKGRSAAFQLLCHLQLDWGPQSFLVTATASLQRTGWRNTRPGTSSRAAAALYCFLLQIMNVSSGLPTIHASKIW